jgi:hypothetical protein
MDETLPLMSNAVVDQSVRRMKYGDFLGKK